VWAVVWPADRPIDWHATVVPQAVVAVVYSSHSVPVDRHSRRSSAVAAVVGNKVASAVVVPNSCSWVAVRTSVVAVVDADTAPFAVAAPLADGNPLGAYWPWAAAVAVGAAAVASASVSCCHW